MKIFLTSTAVTSLLSLSPVHAATIIDVVGDEGIADGLTGGANNAASDNALTGSNNLGGRTEGDDFLAYTASLNDFVSFSFSIPVGATITSATLEIDITDDDGRTLTIYEGASKAVGVGVTIGVTTPVGDNGGPGDWRAVNTLTSGGARPAGNTSPGNIDHSFAIPAGLFADMETDGELILDAAWSSTGGGFWASNRAKLTIETIPEPSSTGLALLGLALAVQRRKRA